MPAIRRSRRILRRPPCDPEYETFDWQSAQLQYPETMSSSPSSEQLHLPSVATPVDLPSPSTSLTDDDGSYVPRQSTHSRKKEPGHIPRPPNAFMLFRSAFWAREKTKTTVERDHRKISCLAAEEWRMLPEKDRAPFKRRAELEKRKHHEAHPEYKYCPSYRKEKLARPPKKRQVPDRAAVAIRSPAQSEVKVEEGDQVLMSDTSFPSPTEPVTVESLLSQAHHSIAVSKPKKKSTAKLHKSFSKRSAKAKREVLPTPSISSQSSVSLHEEGFVPTEDIPPLSLCEDSPMYANCQKVEEFPHVGGAPSFFPPDYYGNQLTPTDELQEPFSPISPHPFFLPTEDLHDIHDATIYSASSVSPYDSPHSSKSDSPFLLTPTTDSPSEMIMPSEEADPFGQDALNSEFSSMGEFDFSQWVWEDSFEPSAEEGVPMITN
ncbi:hypothetical protein C8Q75DRAFT_555208 [Abortiporus biennis]|nr:hypothetical protein C8Q75DRAFT_555208 [Abortiporus biennis]